MSKKNGLFRDLSQYPTDCGVRAIRVEFVTRLSFASRRSSSKADALIA